MAAALARIEAKLDALCEAMAAQDDEGDDQPTMTLDGRMVRSNGTAGQAL